MVAVKIDSYTDLGNISLNIFYFQQITSYTVQYIQFIRKLGLKSTTDVNLHVRLRFYFVINFLLGQ